MCLLYQLTRLSLTGAGIPRVLVGAGLPAATGESPGHPRGYQPRTSEPRRPQAPAQGHPAAAVHPAPVAAGQPGIPGVQQHWALPLTRYVGCDSSNQHKLVHVFCPAKTKDASHSTFSHFLKTLILHVSCTVIQSFVCVSHIQIWWTKQAI